MGNHDLSFDELVLFRWRKAKQYLTLNKASTSHHNILECRNLEARDSFYRGVDANRPVTAEKYLRLVEKAKDRSWWNGSEETDDRIGKRNEYVRVMAGFPGVKEKLTKNVDDLYSNLQKCILGTRDKIFEAIEEYKELDKRLKVEQKDIEKDPFVKDIDYVQGLEDSEFSASVGAALLENDRGLKSLYRRIDLWDSVSSFYHTGKYTVDEKGKSKRSYSFNYIFETDLTHSLLYEEKEDSFFENKLKKFVREQIEKVQYEKQQGYYIIFKQIINYFNEQDLHFSDSNMHDGISENANEIITTIRRSRDSLQELANRIYNANRPLLGSEDQIGKIGTIYQNLVKLSKLPEEKLLDEILKYSGSFLAGDEQADDYQNVEDEFIRNCLLREVSASSIRNELSIWLGLGVKKINKKRIREAFEYIVEISKIVIVEEGFGVPDDKMMRENVASIKSEIIDRYKKEREQDVFELFAYQLMIILNMNMTVSLYTKVAESYLFDLLDNNSAVSGKMVDKIYLLQSNNDFNKKQTKEEIAYNLWEYITYYDITRVNPNDTRTISKLSTFTQNIGYPVDRDTIKNIAQTSKMYQFVKTNGDKSEIYGLFYIDIESKPVLYAKKSGSAKYIINASILFIRDCLCEHYRRMHNITIPPDTIEMFSNLDKEK